MKRLVDIALLCLLTGCAQIAQDEKLIQDAEVVLEDVVQDVAEQFEHEHREGHNAIEKGK